MNLFPQRQSQKAFLAEYEALPHGDDDEGIDLFDDHLDDLEEPDGVADLDGLIAAGDEGAEDESCHKQLDAARRAREEQALQALARRFEERANHEQQLYDVGARQASEQDKLAQARRLRKAQLRAEQAEHAAGEAKEKERSDAINKRKREQLEALYEAFNTLIEPKPKEPTSPCAPVAPAGAAPAAEQGGEASMAKATNGSKQRFRIKKRCAP